MLKSGSSRDLWMLGVVSSQLMHMPESLARAHVLSEEYGSTVDQWYGWDYKSERMADILDMLVMQIKATAQNKAKHASVAPRPMANTTGDSKGSNEAGGARKVVISLKDGVGGLPKADPFAHLLQ